MAKVRRGAELWSISHVRLLQIILPFTTTVARVPGNVVQGRLFDSSTY
jgi:hypothetical protein